MSTVELLEPQAALEPRPVPCSVRGLLVTARPRQWVKNGLVVAAPFAAGALLHSAAIIGTLLAFAAFLCASAAVYLGNDVVDRNRDRAHPRKRHRPVAAGIVSCRQAVTSGLVLAVASVAVPILAGNAMLAVVIGVYLALSGSYALLLKHVPGVEILIVASGFVLRALAGAVGAHVPPSGWFLAVTAFAALSIVVGKRCAERNNTRHGVLAARPVLAAYSPYALSTGRDLALIVAAVSYFGWVLTRGDDRIVFAAVSAVPLAWALLRYRRINQAGGGESPEELLLHDRPLQYCLLLWALGLLAVIILV